MLRSVEDRLQEALRAPCAHRVTLGLGGYAVRLCSDDESMLAWTEWFLTPAFSVVEGPAQGRVVFARDDALVASLRKLQPLIPGGECTPLLQHADPAPPSFEYRLGQLRVLADGETATYWAAAPSGKELIVIAEHDNVRALTTPMKVIRELASVHHHFFGSAIVHAAAYECDGMATLVTAPKRGGKTTHLIQALLRGAAMIANDRVLVRSHSGVPQAHGVPTIVTLRKTTLELFPGLIEEIDRQHLDYMLRSGPPKWPDRRSLAPAQLCSLLDSGARQSAAVGRLLLLRLGKGQPRRLPPAEAAQELRDSLFDYGRPGQRLFVPGLCDTGAAAPVAALNRLLENLCCQAECWEYPRESDGTLPAGRRAEGRARPGAPPGPVEA